MEMQINQVRVLYAAIVVLLFGQSAVAQQVCMLGECNAMTDEFRNLELRPQSIALLPPHSSLKKKGFISSENMVGETEVLEASLANALEVRMTKLGYTVRFVTLADIEADAQLGQLLAQANRRYDEEHAKINFSTLDELKYRRYSVGVEARVLANYLEVDAVAFPRMQAVGATGSAIFFSPTGGGQIHMDFSLVHARTGDIEAFFGAINSGGLFGKSLSSILENPDKHMVKIARTATKKMPAVAKALKHQKMDRSKVRAVELYDAEEPEEVLSDLEDLLAEPEAANGAATAVEAATMVEAEAAIESASGEEPATVDPAPDD